MPVEAAIVARCKEVASVTNLIGAGNNCRVYNRFPKNVSYPAVQYEMNSYRPTSAMGEDLAITNANYRLNCYDTSYTGSKNLAKAIRDAFQRYSGTIAGMVIQNIFCENQIDLYNAKPIIYFVAIDLKIQYEEN